MRFIVLSFVLFITGFFALPKVIAQCKCASPDICRSFNYAEAIVVGISKENRKIQNQDVSVFQIEKSYKGNLKGEIIVDSKLEIGQRYLLYPIKDEKTEIWDVFRCCTSDKKLENAAGDLKFLEKSQNEKIQNRIYGKVINYQTKKPVSTEIEVIGLQKTYSIFSDNDGVYEVGDLPVGNYKIRPKPPQNMKIGSFGRFLRPLNTTEIDIDLDLKECVEIDINLVPKN